MLAESAQLPFLALVALLFRGFAIAAVSIAPPILGMSAVRQAHNEHAAALLSASQRIGGAAGGTFVATMMPLIKDEPVAGALYGSGALAAIGIIGCLVLTAKIWASVDESA